MAIYNELSSDIAAAIIAQKKPAQELEQLKDIILKVHSALQKMSQDAEHDSSAQSVSCERLIFRAQTLIVGECADFDHTLHKLRSANLS